MKILTNGTHRPGGFRVYESWADVKRATKALAKLGFNYFVPYLDVQGPALNFGKAEWVPSGMCHVNGTVGFKVPARSARMASTEGGAR